MVQYPIYTEDFVMTYDEMSNFTHEELSHFTHGELSLEKVQLLYNILNDNSIEIPVQIQDKLYALCSNTIVELEKSHVKIPNKIKEIMSQPHSRKLLIKVIAWLIKLLATSLISAGIKSIHIDEIDFDYNKSTIQNTYYISNGGLNDDVNTIIESINTTTNIKIDIENLTYELDEDTKNN